MELTPTLTPTSGNRNRFPRSPETGYAASRAYSTPPSSSRRPAPIVSGSSVTSGRCCADAAPAARTITTMNRKVRIGKAARRCLWLKLSLAVDRNGYRPIVDQFDAHHGLEFARDNGQLCRTQFSHDAFVQCARLFRRSCGVERRTSPLTDVSVQGERGDNEHTAARIRDRAIHVATCVTFENADIPDLPH